VNLNPLRLFGARPHKRALDESSELYRALAVYAQTASGFSVNDETALSSVAVLGCCQVRAGSFASLPFKVRQRVGRDRVERDDHPVYQLLQVAPNPVLTAPQFWRWEQLQEDLTGNAFARVIFGPDGRPAEIWPMTGALPTMRTTTEGLAYAYGGDVMVPSGVYPAREVLHFKGQILRNPYWGRSIVNLARDTIGLDIAAEQFFARFLANGTHFPGYLATDQDLTEEDYTALKEQLKGSSGVLTAGELRIFDRGLKLMQNAMSLKDAEIVEEQRWLLEQCCRLFRVPLPLLQDWTHGTYSNAEQAGIWFGQHTLTPLAVDKEAVIAQRLFLPSEIAQGYFTKFNIDGLLRGDFATRSTGYSILILCGVLAPNEARAFEDWNPYEGGDDHRLPLNTAPAGSPLAAPPLEPAPDKAKAQEIAPATAPPEDEAARNRLAGENARWAVAAMVRNAGELIGRRAVEDERRGRPATDTEAFAYRVVAPVCESAAHLGIVISPQLLVDEFVGRRDRLLSIEPQSPAREEGPP
jgi:HK97 family phage portal protein